MDLENMNKDGLGKISGAVKTSFGLEEISKINKNILTSLEEGEMVEKVIKIRNIKAIEAITVGSFFGATMALGTMIYDAIINPIKMVIKDGTVVCMLIASDDYKKCYEYLRNMAKEIESIRK